MHRFVIGLLLILTLPVDAVAKVNVLDYGAKADGQTDNTAAIQKALDAAGRDRGGVVEMPKGLYRVHGHLVVPPGVCLSGEWRAPHHANTEHGTVILATGNAGKEDGPALINLQQSSAVKGITVFYPDQDPVAIKPYPWTIQGRGMHGSVIDVTLVNPYKGIDFGTHHNELHYIRNVFGCPLKVGVYVNNTTDIGRIENVHFNPNFWTRMALEPKYPGGDIKAYLEKNLVGFKIGKTDWEYISNCFVIFPRIGFHFDDFGHGPGNAVITQSGSDICPVAVRVDRTQNHAGVQIVNGQFMATVEIGPENRGPVKLTSCGFWGVAETREQVVKQGPSDLLLTACHFTGWAAADKAAPCIRASGGRLVVNGCDFLDAGKKQIVLEKGLTAATITGCLLRGEGGIEDTSGADVQKGLNSTR